MRRRVAGSCGVVATLVSDTTVKLLLLAALLCVLVCVVWWLLLHLVGWIERRKR